MNDITFDVFVIVIVVVLATQCKMSVTKSSHG
jgi:hypothetical protein